MAGEIKLNDVSIATESGGTVTLGNATLGSTVVLGTNGFSHCKQLGIGSREWN
jgi:hypothetical protein